LKKALSDDFGGAFFGVHITTVHLVLLRIIHDFQWIAEIESFEMQKNCKKIKSEHA
jgi:hypothetical protein